MPLPNNASLSNASVHFQSVVVDVSSGNAPPIVTSMLGSITIR